MMNWEEIVKNIEEHSGKDRAYIWVTWYERGNRSQIEYALSTYLMGKKSNSVVFQPQPMYDGGYPRNLAGYDIETVKKEYEENRKMFDVELGEPLENATKVYHNNQYYWRRKFSKGLVLCNPSDTSLVSLTLDRVMLKTDGNQVREIMFKPRTGAILIDKEK